MYNTNSTMLHLCIYMYNVFVFVCRYYGRVCLSHFMEAADFEKVASRTLNSKQWSKMRDVVEMIRVKVH